MIASQKCKSGGLHYLFLSQSPSSYAEQTVQWVLQGRAKRASLQHIYKEVWIWTFQLKTFSSVFLKVYFQLIHHGIKQLNSSSSLSLPKTIQIQNMDEFKIDIKNKIKPKKYKHFAGGNKLGNTLLTRIRVRRSYLNQHKFTIGHIE